MVQKKGSGGTLKNCIHCKKQIRITSKFCSFCGKSVVLKKQKSSQTRLYSVPSEEGSQGNKVISGIGEGDGRSKKPSVKVKAKKKQLNACPYCQKHIPVTEKICSECNRSLKKCSACNMINRGTAKYCRSCQGTFPPTNNMDWPSFRGNNFRSGFFDESLEFPFYFQWMYPSLDDTLGPLWASPVVARDKVFVATKEKYLYAFNQFTGELLWKQPASAPIVCTPAVEGNTVYMGCEDGKIFAVDCDKGGVKWFMMQRFLWAAL